MKILIKLAVLLIIINTTFAQDKVRHVLIEAIIPFTDKQEAIIENYTSTSGLAIVVFHGFDLKKIKVFNFVDSLNYTWVKIGENSIEQRGKGCVTDVNFYNYLFNLNNEHLYLVREHLTSQPNGYKYYVGKEGEIVGSFYSFHDLSYYDLNEDEKSSLQTLYLILDQFDIK